MLASVTPERWCPRVHVPPQRHFFCLQPSCSSCRCCNPRPFRVLPTPNRRISDRLPFRGDGARFEYSFVPFCDGSLHSPRPLTSFGCCGVRSRDMFGFGAITHQTLIECIILNTKHSRIRTSSLATTTFLFVSSDGYTGLFPNSKIDSSQPYTSSSLRTHLHPRS